MTNDKIKIELEDNFSYEIRVYCDKCNEEVGEFDQKDHVCEV